MLFQILAGPRAGFVRATMGHHGHAHTGPAQIPVRARSNAVMDPVQDLTRHSGHAWSNPAQAPAGAVIWVHTVVPGMGLPYLHFDKYRINVVQ